MKEKKTSSISFNSLSGANYASLTLLALYVLVDFIPRGDSSGYTLALLTYSLSFIYTMPTGGKSVRLISNLQHQWLKGRAGCILFFVFYLD